MADLVYPPVILSALGMFRLLGLRLDVQGAERIPARGGAVLACNHISYLDFIFCGLGAHPADRLVRFMAKDAVFRHPVAGPLMRGMHHIPVDRSAGAAAYDAAVAALRAGEVVGVFPEATISRSFELKEFKAGAARMAAAAEVPLVPVVLWGTQRIMTKGRPRDLARGKAVSITVGVPLRVRPADPPEAVTAELQEAMADLLDRTRAAYPDGPRGPADRWWLPVSMGGTAPTPAEAAALDAAEAQRRAEGRSAAARSADAPPPD